MTRSGLGGPPHSLTAGFAYGMAPIVNFGSQALQERFLPILLTGKKRTCIAITEPDAGSDVANITTTATKSADGKHYILNGTKKWYAALFIGAKLERRASCRVSLRQISETLQIGSRTESGLITPPWPCVPVALEQVVSP